MCVCVCVGGYSSKKEGGRQKENSAGVCVYMRTLDRKKQSKERMEGGGEGGREEEGGRGRKGEGRKGKLRELREGSVCFMKIL